MREIARIIEGTGLPFAYDHFAEGESPEPPFVCYLEAGSDNFAADGRVWQRVSRIHVELYTDEKDPSCEAAVEAALDAAGLFWEKSETWIPDERLYETLYTFETKG